MVWTDFGLDMLTPSDLSLFASSDPEDHRSFFDIRQSTIGLRTSDRSPQLMMFFARAQQSITERMA